MENIKLKGKRGQKQNRHPVRESLCLLVCVILLTACGKSGKVVFTTGFGKDEVFRIDSASCTKSEMMVYLTTIQNQYEMVYGSEVWGISKGELTLEDNVKDTALARLAQIKSMCLLAKEKGVELDEEEQELARKAAGIYYHSLNETRRQILDVDEEDLFGMYCEYALADKLYQYIIQDVNPEISDDEARIITVLTIALHTWTTDSNGRQVEYSEKVKKTIYDKAVEIRNMAMEEGQDFLELASRYSQDINLTCSFGKGETEEAFEDAAFVLETGEISPVIETQTGYYIIKCVSTFDRQETDQHKQEIVEERKREVFGEEYDAFTETLVRQLNTRLWSELTLIHEDQVTTASFFEIYDSCFK